ncbi:MAG: cytochrome P450 [Pyrinomonadaceae bacterium]
MQAIVPPGPKSMLPFGIFFRMQGDALQFLTGLARDYGDVSRFRAGSRYIYFFNHPDLIKEILVTHNESFGKGRALQRMKTLLGEGLLTAEGEHYKRQRRLVQPAFHKGRIAGYGAVMSDSAAQFSDRWTDGETLDIANEMMRLTLAIVGKTLFDADVENDAHEVGAAIAELVEMFRFLLLPFSEILEKLPLPQVRRFKRVRERLDAIIYRIINERRQSKTDRGDLLSMLLLAQDELGSGRMSDEQVRDEVLTLFLAGHETTANTLAWTWYLLAQNPQVEAKLHAELDTVLSVDQSPLIAHSAQVHTETISPQPALERLRYTEMVLTESMRLYPPAWTIGRRALRDVTIGGYSIPKDSIVLMSQYVMHRDARFYDEPEKFIPERWTPDERARRPQFAYFPFGGGARRCIGENFAWMEGVLLIATMARNWRMRLVPEQNIEAQPRVTLRPKNGIVMQLERRGQSVIQTIR